MKILDIQNTPNPRAIKFVVDKSLTHPSKIVRSGEDQNHSLIENLASFDFIESIMIQGSWVTINFKSKEDAKDTEKLKTIAEVLRPYDDQGMLTQNKNVDTLEKETFDDPMAILIDEILKDEILPYLNSHGGSIELVEVQDNQVFLRYIGACGGCPASTTATLQGIESLLKNEVDPEIEVVLV